MLLLCMKSLSFLKSTSFETMTRLTKKKHDANTVTAPCEWHDIFTHWSLNVICINFGGVCTLLVWCFYQYFPLNPQKTQLKHALSSDRRIWKCLPKGWFHLVYWYSTSSEQTPSMNIFLLISVTSRSWPKFYLKWDRNAYIYIMWWIQESECSVWMTVCLTLLDEVCLKISLFLPKIYARWIFYILVYLLMLSWYTSHIKVPLHISGIY